MIIGRGSLIQASPPYYIGTNYIQTPNYNILKSYPKILQPQMKLFLHQLLKERSTTLPWLEEASITLPPPATIPTWPLTTTISPALKSPKLLIFVYFPTLLQPADVK